MSHRLTCQMRSVLALTALLFSTMLGAGQAAACACCAEPGHRHDAVETLSANARDEIAAVRLAPVAMLHNGARGADGVTGVRGAFEKPYRVTLTRSSGSFVFDVIDASGQSGRITFTLPARISRFEVDPRQDTKINSNGPTLYTEWRLEGPAALTGIFGGGRATARFVLQGRGNLCTAAPNFSHWTLLLTGAGTKFSLFGDTKN